MIYNNQNPYTIALVVASRDNLNRLLDDRGVTGEARSREAAQIVAAEIAKYRNGGIYASEFPDRWVPAVIALADEPFTEQNGLVNSTMKVVRNKVEKHFAEAIAHAYTAEGKAVDNERNIAAITTLLS
jgi:long-chain acyl-CoA synthetase